MKLLSRVVMFSLVCTINLPPVATAGLLSRIVRGAARSAGKALGRQPLGPLHIFKKPTVLERFTNKPKTDLRKGLGPESFWVRPHPGAPGSAEHVQKKLNIPHPLTQEEKTVVPPGTPYHERPVQGGTRGSRETIVHAPVPGHNITPHGPLPRGDARP